MADVTWNTEYRRDRVAQLHLLGVPETTQRLVRWHEPELSALVLGSTQPESDVRADVAEELGIEVVRRRSGGGAVLVEPADIAWVDVFVPAGDVLWHADVGRSFHWLGNIWASVLKDLLGLDADVHTGGLITTEWSRRICFAGIGPGEVTIGHRKAVGISQRRTRSGALFQCAVLLGIRADRFASMIVETASDTNSAVDVLNNSTFPLEKVEISDLIDRFERHLPTD